MPDLSAPAWPADRLVFLNDVYFCASDLIRLLQHDETDMACGMDFTAWKSPPSTNDIQPYGPYGPPLSVSPVAAVTSDRLTGPLCVAESCHTAVAADWGALQSQPRSHKVLLPGRWCMWDYLIPTARWADSHGLWQVHCVAHMGGSVASRAILQACGGFRHRPNGTQVVHDPEQLQFYDFWVARDVDGLPLSNLKPFVHHGYSLQRLEQGLPFPVACCWNGMVSMNAEPFTHHSVRFRSALTPCFPSGKCHTDFMCHTESVACLPVTPSPVPVLL